MWEVYVRDGLVVTILWSSERLVMLKRRSIPRERKLISATVVCIISIAALLDLYDTRGCAFLPASVCMTDILQSDWIYRTLNICTLLHDCWLDGKACSALTEDHI
jgi:hypothetical protein